MLKFAPKIFQLFGLLMALNLVYLLAANGETNPYTQAATLAAIGAHGATSPVAAAALYSAAMQNANNAKSGVSTKSEGRAAQATPAPAPTAVPTQASLASVPDALKKGTAVNETASPMLGGLSSGGSPGDIASLIAKETARIKKTNDDYAQTQSDDVKAQIADITDTARAKVYSDAKDAQKQVNTMLGLDQDHTATPVPTPETLAAKIVKTTLDAGSQSLREKLGDRLNKADTNSLSLKGITAQ